MSSVFLEAESFRNRGGWVVDTVPMHRMGSACLMAHGAGVPVADAETEIDIDCPGEYHLFARTRDWTAVWKRGTPAGRRRRTWRRPTARGRARKWARSARAASPRRMSGSRPISGLPP